MPTKFQVDISKAVAMLDAWKFVPPPLKKIAFLSAIRSQKASFPSSDPKFFRTSYFFSMWFPPQKSYRWLPLAIAWPKWSLYQDILYKICHLRILTLYDLFSTRAFTQAGKKCAGANKMCHTLFNTKMCRGKMCRGTFQCAGAFFCPCTFLIIFN